MTLKSILKQSPPASASPLSLDPKQRFLAEPEIAALVRDCKRALAAYELACLENHNALYPEQAAQRLRQDLARTTDPEEVSRLSHEIQRLTHPSAVETKEALKSAALEKLSEAERLVVELLSKAADRAADYEREARQIEADFFGRYGLRHEVTSLSRRYAEFASAARSQHGAYTATSPYVRPILKDPASTPLTAFFGVALTD